MRRTLLPLLAALAACGPAAEAPRDADELLECSEAVFRPTAEGATIHWVARVELEARLRWGSDPGELEHERELSSRGPTEVVIDDQPANREVHYRLELRRRGEEAWASRPTRSFHTARARGSTFQVGLFADSHLYTVAKHKAFKDLRATMRRLVEDDLDFLVFLGDEAGVHFYGDTVETMNTNAALERWRGWRRTMTPLLERFPTTMALGNHEGEAGFYRELQLPRGVLNLQRWGTTARKHYYLNPLPTTYPEGGEDADWVDEGAPSGNRSPLQNYFAWTWGDALFVVIDVHRYTEGEPRTVEPGNPSMEVRVDVDDWTLGEEQLAWLGRTLEESDATHKLLFAHHLVGGWGYGLWGQDREAPYKYGRGGARYARQGEQSAITDLMRRHGARYFFYGHDHVFAHQASEGVEFVCCGRPSYLEPAWWSSEGWLEAYGPREPADPKSFLGTVGYTRLTVGPETLAIEYVRTPERPLPGENVSGGSGEVVYRWESTEPSPEVELVR